MTASNKQVYTGAGTRSEIFNLPFDIATVVNAGSGSDYILAYQQNDDLTGGSDRDYILGLNGNDTIYGDNIADGVQGVLIFSDADVINGGAGNDLIFGQSGADFVSGDNGVDTIFGGVGNDFLQGGLGADTIYGGDNDDTIFGGGGTAPASYAFTVNYTFNGIDDTALNGSVPALINASNSEDTSNDYLDGGAGQDTIFGQDGADTLLGGDDNDVLDGGTGSDLIFGGRGDDVLRGSFGADLLEGDDGNDQLSGAEDNDIIHGGGGYDTVYFTDATGGVSVDLDVGTSKLFFGNAGNDTLDSIEAVAGTAFADQVIGSYVANIIDTGGGNDVLYGAYGADILIGGAGADRFVYAEQAESSLTSIDRIVDFQSGLDKIDLSVARAGRSFSVATTSDGNGGTYLDVDFSQDGTVNMRIDFAAGTNFSFFDLVI